MYNNEKIPYYTLQDKANPNAPPTYQIYHESTQPINNMNSSLTLADNINLASASVHSTTSTTTTISNPTLNITSTLSSPPLQSQHPKNILSELVVSTGDELIFQTKKSEIENSLKLIKSIEDRFTEEHLQHDKIFLSRINSYTNGYIPLLHLTAYSDISKYSQNNLEYMANAIETYSRQLELNPERTHVKRKGQGTALPLEELIANLVPTAKRTLVALNIDSTQKQKQQEILDQCRSYMREWEEEEREKKRNSVQNHDHFNLNNNNTNQIDMSSISSLLIQRSVKIAYIEDSRDYRNMFYKPEDLCKDIFEPMDSIPYSLLEFDSERTANYIYSRFEEDLMKSNENHNSIIFTNNVNEFINPNDEIYVEKPVISSATSSTNLSSSTNSPISLNLTNDHRTSLEITNPVASMNHLPSFINPLNTFNNNVDNIFIPTSTSPIQAHPPSSRSTIQTTNQLSSEMNSSLSLKRTNPADIAMISSANNSSMNTSSTLHSGNSVNSGIKPSLFNSSPSIVKDYQKQQVFFQNNIQYNGKIYKLDPIKCSGYIQLSDEVISVLLNDTRNEGKSFELIKSYLVYFSYSDVEVSHLPNMKEGDNVSFKVKMTFIAPSNINPISMKSSNSSPLAMEDNSITQAFDIFIKNKNNIPPDVLEMMKMMETIF
ncbi:hypothetical protein H8356DRAFT_1270726 [Neocallimastix lanati (nom. inval.)]|uniref:HTH La-type RNA-binding domain-containing protein n=1 Tax=Neocallimastix californiae TaxID=1754190 RepID=A0A1Y2FVJ9_9FUNG|nr:hypothetical protein H8356DRAFT_1270726 [Neocallimastix sp. JGI-2020a]ORY87216.1 hypothetical protein LY90DRAFT_498472 [Neocallimastix californiae]|eukprot:ORY87216.1 hypothetical protein LY90DRAFT_498472 [Neocallimastix californiae]